jgi:CBS domain-containing protein
MVVVDEANRPRKVLVPAGGRRANRHPAMCIQHDDDIQDVALRAAARQSEDRYGPLCLCNENGSLEGIISIETLLDALAGRYRARPSFA